MINKIALYAAALCLCATTARATTELTKAEVENLYKTYFENGVPKRATVHDP